MSTAGGAKRGTNEGCEEQFRNVQEDESGQVVLRDATVSDRSGLDTKGFRSGTSNETGIVALVTP